MQLVHGHRRIERVAMGSLSHPRVVPPIVFQVPDDGCGPRWRFRVEGKRVGLLHSVALEARRNQVFVPVALHDPGHEAFPDSRAASRLQPAGIVRPVIEIADHGDAFGVRRPHRELDARLPVHHADMSAQPFV